MRLDDLYFVTTCKCNVLKYNDKFEVMVANLRKHSHGSPTRRSAKTMPFL